MSYSRFEALVLSVGVAAIIGSLFFGYGGTVIAEEIVAQLLLLGVLFGAVHWGRTGGFITALAASAIYIVLRIPLVIGEEGLTSDIVALLLIRVVTYGLIGIVGGELSSRIKYIFAKLENNSSIDDWTQIFNQRFIARSLESAYGQATRYDTPCSVVTVGLSAHLTSDLRVSKQRALFRGVANYLRGDIRLVDEVGRLDDGQFIVVLPQTGKSGALVVTERLYKGVCDALGAKPESVTVTTLSMPEDADEFVALKNTLSPHSDDDAALPLRANQTSIS